MVRTLQPQTPQEREYPDRAKFSSRVMPLSSEEDKFVEAASAALPRIAEIIAAFPPEHRAGALELAKRRYVQAAREFGCTQAETERWVAAIMRKLRIRVEEKSKEQGK